MTHRSHLGRLAGLTAASLLLVLAAVPVRASDPPSPGPVDAILAIDAWTNDDGNTDEGDPGDTGVTTVLFDNWDPGSSSDPSEPGWESSRYDKDVARCSAEVGDGADVAVVVDAAYPGYTCTFMVVYLNASGVPVVPVEPAVVLPEGGVLTVTVLDHPESAIPPGETFSVSAAVTVEQVAPMHDSLQFSIVLTLTGEDECALLDPSTLPEGAVLANASGTCTYFFDAKPGSCGPHWTADLPYAWHFVVNRTGGAEAGTLTAVFLSDLELTTDAPSKILRNSLHYHLYTESPDTLVGAYWEGGADRARLVLSGTCNDPDGFGQVATADLQLSAGVVLSSPTSARYTFSLTNRGTAPASEVVVRTVLDRPVLGSTTTTGSLASDGVWLVPLVGPGATETVVLSTSVNPGTYTASAEIAQYDGLPAPLPATAEARLVVPEEAPGWMGTALMGLLLAATLAWRRRARHA